jgi:hypothetical protein
MRQYELPARLRGLLAGLGLPIPMGPRRAGLRGPIPCARRQRSERRRARSRFTCRRFPFDSAGAKPRERVLPIPIVGIFCFNIERVSAAATRASVRPLTTTFAASAARAVAIAKPIPAVEPDTTATLPRSPRSISCPRLILRISLAVRVRGCGAFDFGDVLRVSLSSPARITPSACLALRAPTMAPVTAGNGSVQVLGGRFPCGSNHI